MAVRSRDSLRRVRHKRVRKNLRGTAERPRLAVYRSLKHIYAQIIDDDNGVTLVAASTRAGDAKGSDVKAAEEVGKALGAKAKEKGISAVVFDRGGYRYHGRVASLAKGAREAGLEF